MLRPNGRSSKLSYHNGFRERHSDFLRGGHRESVRACTEALSAGPPAEGRSQDEKARGADQAGQLVSTLNTSPSSGSRINARCNANGGPPFQRGASTTATTRDNEPVARQLPPLTTACTGKSPWTRMAPSRDQPQFHIVYLLSPIPVIDDRSAKSGHFEMLA